MQSLVRLQSSLVNGLVFTSAICVRKTSNARGSIAKTIAALERQQKQAAKSMYAPQKFTNFLVVDLEATCNQDGPPPYPQEIIEFPVLHLCGRTFQEVSRFHTYVQPDVHKELSDFCIELTGIVQSMLADKPSLKTVLISLDEWMQNNSITQTNSAVVTFGEWDMASALVNQCQYLGIAVPPIFRQWINLKKSLLEHTRQWPRNLSAALRNACIEQKGRPHSGIDDCLNIAELMRYLARSGYVFHFTGGNNLPKYD
ncbi:ERI1 exoribonuclease 3-like [Varroa jacobsoni]|uniref:ERI1 exoribonuclease 3-like n=1 Tax=Varroa jacobsoni TaxID=62625 RepID=UPI000BF69A4B|nr:ERI1 exoribonuclease 3-like [Varroa jacobsoni]